MRSPFPGMDPYLEDPDRWPDVHLNLLAGVSRLLQPQLGPNYVARIRWREFRVEPDDPADGLYLLPEVGVRRTGRSRAISRLSIMRTLSADMVCLP